MRNGIHQKPKETKTLYRNATTRVWRNTTRLKVSVALSENQSLTPGTHVCHSESPATLTLRDQMPDVL